MTATSPSKRPALSIPSRKLPLAEASSRELLDQQARQLLQQAGRAAEEGDIAQSARLILQALDCERRSGGSGPQVLQLIKPRG